MIKIERIIVKYSIEKVFDKDLKLYNDFSKTLSQYRLTEFRLNESRFGINYASISKNKQTIKHNKLLKQLAKRLKIQILI